MFYSTQHLFCKKGSVLVFSLIILSLMLISALSVATISVNESKSALTGSKSNRSFQVADSGVELVLERIYKGSYATLNALAASLGTTCNANGEMIATLNAGTDSSYTISFYGTTGKFTSGDCASATWRTRLTGIRSEGTSGNTVRAVEVAVKAP